MENLQLYGFEKVEKAYRLRLREIQLLDGLGERTARMMAWNAFVENELTLDQGNAATSTVARLKYVQSIKLNDGDVYIKEDDFIHYFIKETFVINKKVTSKKVQILFYIVLALAVFGIYSIFS